MNDLPRQKLCEIIAKYGKSICDDARRCESLLRDLCGSNKREIRLLVSALRERVPDELLNSPRLRLTNQATISRICKRLHDDVSMTEEAARWAVESWALALTLITPTELSKISPPKAVSISANLSNQVGPATRPQAHLTETYPPLISAEGLLESQFAVGKNIVASTHQPYPQYAPIVDETTPQSVRSNRKSTFLVLAGGLAVLLIAGVSVVVVGYMYFFSESRTILDQVARGNLVKPVGTSAYDLYLKYSESESGTKDLEEISSKVVPLLETRGEEILNRLKLEGIESDPDWRESMRIYDWLNRLQPSGKHDSRKYFSQARVEFLAKEYDKAIAEYRRSIDLDSSWALPLNALGRTYYAKKDRAKAAEYYTRATTVEPTWIIPWLNLAGLHLESKDYRSMQSAVHQALAIDPQKASAHYFLGLALEGLGDGCGALGEFKLSVANAPNQDSSGSNMNEARKRISELSAKGVCEAKESSENTSFPPSSSQFYLRPSAP